MAFIRATALLGAALVLGTASMVGSAGGAMAADLGNYDGGSIKDGGYVPTYSAPHRSFYVRLDGGYSWNTSPDISETMTSATYVHDLDKVTTKLVIDGEIPGFQSYEGAIAAYPAEPLPDRKSVV